MNSTSMIGSIGKSGDAETGGGGRILIFSDSLTIIGNGTKLEANARPEKDYKGSYGLQGGSGGYIYVNTENKIRQNTIGPQFKIEAKGGYGFGSFYGGSGGMIVLDGGLQLKDA